MKAGRSIPVAALGVCAAGAAALCFWHRRKPVQPVGTEVTPENCFLSEWASVLTSDARVFNGLYGGLQRAAGGTAKKPEKILREWCQRTHYKWEYAPADILCQQHIVPLIETEDRDALVKWAELLLNAAAAAGITKETADKIVLTESDVNAYVEWDGNDLYPEDEIEIITPAWYQNGKLLEQGQCRKLNTSAQ